MTNCFSFLKPKSQSFVITESPLIVNNEIGASLFFRFFILSYINVCTINIILDPFETPKFSNK